MELRTTARGCKSKTCLLLIAFALILPTSAAIADPSDPDTSSDALNNYVEFANPTNQVTEDHQLCKQWQPQEIDDMRKRLSEILSGYQGLIKLATCYRKLALYRCSMVVDQGTESHSAWGFTFANRVYLSDSFFDRDDRTTLMLHELVHAADPGGRVAYSSEFVRFAAPTINFANAEHLHQSQNQLAGLDWLLRRTRIAPGLNAACNLEEALAEDFAAFARCEGYSIPLSVLLRLSHPSNQDFEWNKRFNCGREYLKERHFDLALREFQAAEAIDQSSPLCHSLESICLWHTGHREESKARLQHALDMYIHLKVPKNDRRKLHVQYAYADELMSFGRFDSALKMFDEVLESRPDQNLLSEVRSRRQLCTELMASAKPKSANVSPTPLPTRQ